MRSVALLRGPWPYVCASTVCTTHTTVHTVCAGPRSQCTLWRMSKIVVTHDLHKIGLLLQGIGGKTIRQTVARSIKRTVTTLGKAASMEFRSRKLVKMKASQLKRRLRQYTNVGAAKPVEQQYGKLWITGHAESLGIFYARRRYAGKGKIGTRLYKVQVNALGAPYLVVGKAFLVKRGSGNVVFARIGNNRLPIKKQYGPGMAQVATESGIMPGLARVASDRYQKEFDTNLNFYVQRALERAQQGK